MENTRTIDMLDAPGVYGTLPHTSHYSSKYAHTSSAERELTGLRASQACIACRKQKRKCDKTLPACSLCVRMSRGCDYSDSTPTPNADDFAILRQKVSELESRLEAKSAPPWGRTSTIAGVVYQHQGGQHNEDASVFPAAFLLDAAVFKEARMTIPVPSVEIPQKIHNSLGSVLDMRDIVDRYFENIHQWLPIHSRKRMQIKLQTPSLELTADLALLLLCMKLITQGGHTTPQDAQSPLYWMIKRHATVVESSGLITLYYLQSLLLITAYELGHAIYPAAYLSSGHCARISTLMGIHDRQHAPQLLRKCSSWAELEELRRCWWACLLFDRYVHIGGGSVGMIVTDDPVPQTVLPCDDDAFDLGDMSPCEPLYVSTATTVQAGAFARTCQATHLMGRLIRNTVDHYSEPSARFSEAIQLHRVITALCNVISYEAFNDKTRYTTAAGVCLSALLHLCEPYCCSGNRGAHTPEETEMQAIAIPGLQEAAKKALGLGRVIRDMLDNNAAGVSPLVADALYMSCTTFQWLMYESRSEEMVEAYKTSREALDKLSKRWVVATEYIRMIDVMNEGLYAGKAFF